MIYSEDLIRLEKSLSNIVNLEQSEVLQNKVGIALQSEILLGFRNSTDPFGIKWKPVKRKRGKGANQPLIDTGRLRDSIQYKLSDNKIIIGSNMIYAKVHNEGLAPVKHQRQFIPDSSNLPDSWTDIINKQVLNFINDQASFIKLN